MRRRSPCLALLFATSVLCAGRAAGQATPSLLGTVFHADARTPAVAVLIEVLDATNSVAGRTLTAQGGVFALPLPVGRAYTVRALRVGYRPTVLRDVAVSDTGATIRVVLEEATIRLNVAQVTTDDKCGVQSGDGGLVATAWEEVRKAIASADAAGSRTAFEADVLNWYSVHPPDGSGPIYQDFSRRMLDSPKPYAGVPANEVSRAGYARPGPGGAVDYLGPDAETLTSGLFPLTHCFRLVPPQASRPWLGVAFRPRPERVGLAIVEIEGTFWIDTSSAALRLLEYRYTNAPPSFGRIGAGGRIEFDQLASGEWLIRRWTIRLATEVVRGSAAAGIHPTSTPWVAASGGVVTSLRGRNSELLAPPQRAWRAQFVASDATTQLEGATVEFADGGFFAIADASGTAIVTDVAPGRHPVLASTALMRGLTLPPTRLVADVGPTGGSAEIRVPGAVQLLAQRCGASAENRREAAVFGSLVRAGDSVPTGSVVHVATIRDGARETATGQRWRADSLTLASGRSLSDLGDSADPDTFGRWVACGVVRGTTVRVTVVDGQKRVAGVAYVRVESNDRIVEAGTLVSLTP